MSAGPLGIPWTDNSRVKFAAYSASFHSHIIVRFCIHPIIMWKTFVTAKFYLSFWCLPSLLCVVVVVVLIHHCILVQSAETLTHHFLPEKKNALSRNQGVLIPIA